MMRISTASWRMCLANGFLEPIFLPLQTRGQGLFACVVSMAALAAVALSAVTPGVKVLAVACVVLVVGREWQGRSSGCSSSRIGTAWLGADERWRFRTGTGTWTEAQLVHCWGITLGPVMALQWVLADGDVRRTWLLKGATPARAWRRLRVRLRMHRPAAVAASRR